MSLLVESVHKQALTQAPFSNLQPSGFSHGPWGPSPFTAVPSRQALYPLCFEEWPELKPATGTSYPCYVQTFAELSSSTLVHMPGRSTWNSLQCIRLSQPVSSTSHLIFPSAAPFLFLN
ncbi:hypothetical protein VULLAG_LOCUS4721 [Vulpes lagopus]